MEVEQPAPVDEEEEDAPRESTGPSIYYNLVTQGSSVRRAWGPSWLAARLGTLYCTYSVRWQSLERDYLPTVLTPVSWEAGRATP